MNEQKKTVTVVVPVYNEEAMIREICQRVRGVFAGLKRYDYEIVFFDDGSTDGTAPLIRKLSQESEDIKGVFLAKNFGYLKNTFYGMQQARGDCAILVHGDLQNPPELIPEFLEKWEKGAQVVLGVKNKSRENRFMYFLRSVFYFLMIHFFGVRLVPHATEFELFDRSFLDILKEIRSSNPFLRGIVLEYAGKLDYVFYTQDARKKGRSKFNLSKYYSFAICGITQYSDCLPRRGIFCCVLALLALVGEFFFSVVPMFGITDGLTVSNAIVLRCILAAVLVLMIFVCIGFEYVIAAGKERTQKPLVVEAERVNY